MPDQPADFFHEMSAPALARPDVATGTMMGFPCLRVEGAFFASCDHGTGDLIVKLPATGSPSSSMMVSANRSPRPAAPSASGS